MPPLILTLVLDLQHFELAEKDKHIICTISTHLFTNVSLKQAHSTQDKKDNENVDKMYAYMEKNGMFNEFTIMNVFTEQKAVPQQAKDMLEFREIGRDAYMH